MKNLVTNKQLSRTFNLKIQTISKAFDASDSRSSTSSSEQMIIELNRERVIRNSEALNYNVVGFSETTLEA